MNTDTGETAVRVILDTNIFISALVFGGVPEKVLRVVLKQDIQVITSPVLQAEAIDIITKKFPLSLEDMYLLEEEMQKSFIIVRPSMVVNIARDKDDNRVLEAAVEGECNFIITGDQDLLDLEKYKNIKIITPSQFLEKYSQT